ncbi:unnamed protein product, partial [marine sediment metagenome]
PEEPKTEESAQETVAGLPKETFDALTFETAKRLEKKMSKDMKSQDDEEFTKVGRGELSMVEYLVWSDRKDRIDEKRREERLNKGNKALTAEDIGKEVGAQLQYFAENLGIRKSGNKPEEKPEWAEKDAEVMSKILKRMEGEEEDEKLDNKLDKKLGPMGKTLETVVTKVESLSKSAPEGTAPPKSELKTFLEIRKLLKEEDIIGTKSNIMLGPDGKAIPISGEIPALAVYGPYLAEQILNTIEKTADNIGKKYGLIGEEAPTGMPKKPRESLIKMPPKPV